MADKSQRNQFKKKVTTCPLLLSLFLLGVDAAAKTNLPSLTSETFTNIAINSDYVVTTALANYYDYT